MTDSMIDKQLILPGITEGEKDAVLKKMSERLFELGYVKESYYEALLEREQTYPTGIPGQYLTFAMPHTVAEHVKRQGICIGICKQDIFFTSMEDREQSIPCRVIFMLAVTDAKQHLGLMRSLMKITQNEALAQKLLHASSKEDVVAIFESIT